MPDPKVKIERAGTPIPSEADIDPLAVPGADDENGDGVSTRLAPNQTVFLLGLVARLQRLEGALAVAQAEGRGSAQAIAQVEAATAQQLDQVRALALAGRDRTISNQGQAEWESGSQNAEWRELVNILE